MLQYESPGPKSLVLLPGDGDSNPSEAVSRMDHPDSITPMDSPPAPWPQVYGRMTWADSVVVSKGYTGGTAFVLHRIATRSATSRRMHRVPR